MGGDSGRIEYMVYIQTVLMAFLHYEENMRAKGPEHDPNIVIV